MQDTDDVVDDIPLSARAANGLQEPRRSRRPRRPTHTRVVVTLSDEEDEVQSNRIAPGIQPTAPTQPPENQPAAAATQLAAHATTVPLVQPTLFAGQALQAQQTEASAPANPSSCIICMETLDKEGPHRAGVLRCGHVFGQSCIITWLKQFRQGGKCPTCNKKAKADQVVLLWDMPTVESGGAARARELEEQVAKAHKDRLAAQKELEDTKRELEKLKKKQLKQQQQKGTQQQGTTPKDAAFAAALARAHAAGAPASPVPQGIVVRYPEPTHPHNPRSQMPAHTDPSHTQATTLQPSLATHIGPIVLGPLAPQQHAHQQLHDLPLLTPLSALTQRPCPPRLSTEVLLSQPLEGARCADMSLSKDLLLASLATMQGGHALHGSSMLHGPTGRRHFRIPLRSDVTCVRDIRIHPSNHMCAVSTSGAGLMVLSLTDNTQVTKLAEGEQVWSSYWSASNEHQIYAGMNKGRVAVFDIRWPCQAKVVFELPSKAPVHTISQAAVHSPPAPGSAGVEQLSGSTQSGDGSLQYLIAATCQGVYQITRASPGVISPLVTPSSFSPGSCESAVLHHSKGDLSPSLVVSWRPGGNGSVARHAVYSLNTEPGKQPFQQTTHAHPQPVSLRAQEERVLTSHTSNMFMTRATVLPRHNQSIITPWTGSAPQGSDQGLWLASADEESCTPWLWDMTSGALVGSLAPHCDPVLQLFSSCMEEQQAPGLGSLVGALSPGKVEVHRLY